MYVFILPCFECFEFSEYQQASTNHYTDKPCATNSAVSAYNTTHQRASSRASTSVGYDHTKVKEYYRRHQHIATDQYAYSRDRQTTFEHRRPLRASSTYHSTYYYGSSQGLGHSSHLGESAGRDVTSTSDIASQRQRRSYYHERLTTGTRHDRTVRDVRKSPNALEQGLSVERTEWRTRDWARIKRTSPAVVSEMEDDTSSGKHSIGRGSSVVQATTSTTESATYREESKSLRASDRSSQLQLSTSDLQMSESDRTSSKRSQTYPYHYRMDTFATTQRVESFSSLEMYQPIVQTVLRDRLVKRGSNLILVCSFWGINCEIEWVHNYTKINNGAKYRISRHQGMSILEIYDITHQEAGMYKCVVRNDCGEDVTNCCILVLDHIRLSSTKQTRPDRHTLTRRY